MKATELRIGNLIYKGAIYGNEPVRAYELNEYSRFKKGAPVADYYKVWDSIPLTEEWLKKFGFIWNEELKSYEKIGFHWLAKKVELNGSWKFWNNIHQCMLNDTFYWHVHSLQNLYFALTGEELKLIK